MDFVLDKLEHFVQFVIWCACTARNMIGEERLHGHGKMIRINCQCVVVLLTFFNGSYS